MLAKSDELYLKNKDQLAYAAYDSSENFKRPPDMSIKDHLITSERLHHKILQYNIKLPEPVLAYRVLTVLILVLRKSNWLVQQSQN